MSAGVSGVALADTKKTQWQIEAELIAGGMPLTDAVDEARRVARSQSDVATTFQADRAGPPRSVFDVATDSDIQCLLDQVSEIADPRPVLETISRIFGVSAIEKVAETGEGAVAIPATAFESKQMALFQDFSVNRRVDREDLSNAIVLWDCVPRYSVSKETMRKKRIHGRFLDIYNREFLHDAKLYRVKIQPCLVEEAVKTLDGTTVTQTLSYYPSLDEEIIEEVLRKLAVEKAGFYDSSTNVHRGGLVFSLYQLQQELKRMKHSRSKLQIKKSLHILANSMITLEVLGARGSDLPDFRTSGYLSSLGRFYDGGGDEGNSRWIAVFHPLVTSSINNLTYRQFNYTLLMQLTRPLSRWLMRYLIALFTQASRTKIFRIQLSTIRRDSGLLDQYENDGRREHESVKETLEEMKRKNLLKDSSFVVIYGARHKLMEVTYELQPSQKMIDDVVASNQGKNERKEKANVAIGAIQK